MKEEIQEYESLQLFSRNAEQFPMTMHCLEYCLESGKTLRCPEHENVHGENEQADMRIICAGRQDGENCYVICQLAILADGMVYSFVAKAEDENGREIARADFVSFETNRAYARLKIPAAIFHGCYVFMEASAVSATGVSVNRNQGISLQNLYAEQINADYRVGAPVITRKSSLTEQINADYRVGVPVITRKSSLTEQVEISYFDRVGDRENYDYIYNGRGSGIDQMYLDSYGSITLEDIELKCADAVLTVSKGQDGDVCSYPGQKYPGQAEVEVRGNTIHYQFDREWKGVKLTECLKDSVFAMVNYLLEITAVTADRQILDLIITNDKEILKGGKDGHIKEILPLHAYLDCLGEGTMISMADGSKKAIEQIQAGEWVATKDGGSALVKENRCQGERQVLTIYLDHGGKLCLTAGHAVSTAEGVYPAVHLKAGQQLVSVGGMETIKQIAAQCDRLFRVYALSLEEGAEWIYAGGVMVYSADSGDLFCDRDWVREQLPQEWLEDYDNALKAGLIYGK